MSGGLDGNDGNEAPSDGSDSDLPRDPPFDPRAARDRLVRAARTRRRNQANLKEARSGSSIPFAIGKDGSTVLIGDAHDPSYRRELAGEKAVRGWLTVRRSPFGAGKVDVFFDDALPGMANHAVVGVHDKYRKALTAEMRQITRKQVRFSDDPSGFGGKRRDAPSEQDDLQDAYPRPAEQVTGHQLSRNELTRPDMEQGVRVASRLRTLAARARALRAQGAGGAALDTIADQADGAGDALTASLVVRNNLKRIDQQSAARRRLRRIREGLAGLPDELRGPLEEAEPTEDLLGEAEATATGSVTAADVDRGGFEAPPSRTPGRLSQETRARARAVPLRHTGKTVKRPGGSSAAFRNEVPRPGSDSGERIARVKRAASRVRGRRLRTLDPVKGLERDLEALLNEAVSDMITALTETDNSTRIAKQRDAYRRVRAARRARGAGDDPEVSAALDDAAELMGDPEGNGMDIEPTRRQRPKARSPGRLTRARRWATEDSVADANDALYAREAEREGSDEDEALGEDDAARRRRRGRKKTRARVRQDERQREGRDRDEPEDAPEEGEGQEGEGQEGEEQEGEERGEEAREEEQREEEQREEAARRQRLRRRRY